MLTIPVPQATFQNTYLRSPEGKTFLAHEAQEKHAEREELVRQLAALHVEELRVLKPLKATVDAVTDRVVKAAAELKKAQDELFRASQQWKGVWGTFNNRKGAIEAKLNVEFLPAEITAMRDLIDGILDSMRSDQTRQAPRDKIQGLVAMRRELMDELVFQPAEKVSKRLASMDL